MRIRVLLIAAMAALSMPFLAAPAHAALGHITGTVVGSGGTPLAGIQVNAYSKIEDGHDPDEQWPDGSTTTDAEGHYTLAPATYTDIVVCFESPNYVHECYGDGYYPPSGFPGRYGTDLDVGAGDVSGVDASLIVGASVSGTVTNSQTAEPVTNSTIEVRVPSSGIYDYTHVYQAYTDGSGDYTIAHIEPATANICAGAPKLLSHCTGDEGGPNRYALEDGDVITDVNFTFASYPTGIRVVSTGTGKLQFAWDKLIGATGYRVAVSTSSDMSNPQLKYPLGNWITLSGLKTAYRYYIVVRATALTGITDPSPVASELAGIVDGVAAQGAGTGALSVSWLPFSGAAKYQVEISSSPTFSGYRSRVTLKRLTVISSLVPTKGYFVRVRPLRASGTPLAGWSRVAQGNAGV